MKGPMTWIQGVLVIALLALAVAMFFLFGYMFFGHLDEVDARNQQVPMGPSYGPACVQLNWDVLRKIWVCTSEEQAG